MIFGAQGIGGDLGGAFVVLGGDTLEDLDLANGGLDGVLNVADLDGSNGFTVTGNLAGASTGFSVSSAGDVNDDGRDDLLIGAPFDNVDANRGQATLLFGQSSFAADITLPLTPSEGYILNGFSDNDFENFGVAVSGAGDFNGDGIDDIVIGANNSDPQSAAGDGNEGAAFLVLGGLVNLVDLDDDDGTPDGQISIGQLDPDEGTIFAGDDTYAGAGLGYAVSSAGDVNGDGFDDLILGAPSTDETNGNDLRGAAYLVFGREDITTFDDPERVEFFNGLEGVAFRGLADTGALGREVAGGGDINGDGFDDFAIATPYSDAPNGNNSGGVFVLFGKPAWGSVDLADLDGSNGFRLPGLRIGDYAGFGLSFVGDVNGDGFDDLMIVSPYFDQIGADSPGAAFVIFGKPDGFDAEIDLGALNGNDGFRIDAPAQNSLFLGRGAGSAAGDVNGDGFDDIVLGGRNFDSDGLNNSGAGFVVYGQKAQSSVTRIGTDLAQTQNGGIGDDLIDGRDGSDSLIGHEGDDTIFGGAGNDTIDGGADSDTVFGGSGGDRFFLGSGEDTISGGSGADSIDLGTFETGQTLRLFDGSVGAEEDLTEFTSIENLFGTMERDILAGNGRVNFMAGRGGDDQLSGGQGNDQLVGNAGRDVLFGGAGNDTFTYFNTSDSQAGAANRDRIADFTQGEDRLRLVNIDAETGTGGNQTFSFVDRDAFSGTEGELRFTISKANNFTLVFADTDGDRQTDFQIELTGTIDLQASDFIL
ncbi:MAG: hypothetical protein AAFR17_11615 [Pseudomonadota bacterium]